MFHIVLHGFLSSSSNFPLLGEVCYFSFKSRFLCWIHQTDQEIQRISWSICNCSTLLKELKINHYKILTTRYHEERAFGRTPKEAAQQSLEHCSQSILTSGLTFFAATVGVAAISKMELLRSICLLISRGALISMLVILVVLPAALMLCDWLIRHTTLKWMVPESANAKKSEKE